MEDEVMSHMQGNKYDKIVKENIASLLPVVIKSILELDISDTVEIPGEIQYTRERKPDLIKKVTDQNDDTFILHLEWQTQNDKNMVYRMAEYAVMLQRKYLVPVKQYVIFMGKGKVTMSANLDFENLKFWYHILSIKDFDYKFFLESDDPATKIFAILANFGEDGEDMAIANIVYEVRDFSDGTLQQGHFYNQLKVLSRLRNNIINLKLNSMISLIETFVEDEDYLENEKLDLIYQAAEIKTEKRERARTLRETAIKMKELGLGNDLIAQVTNLPIEEIEMM